MHDCTRAFYAQFTPPAKHDKTVLLSVSCQAVWTESARPHDKCVLRRSASGGRTDSACAARHTPTLNALVGPTQFTPPHQTRQDGPVCVESGVSVGIRRLLWTCSDFSATVLSCRESCSHRRSGRDTDKTALSCLAWRCELAFSRHAIRIVVPILRDSLPAFKTLATNCTALRSVGILKPTKYRFPVKCLTI